MTADPAELPPQVRAKVDAHLDAVEQALRRAGSGRDEARSVTDDIETQILDMLAARAAGRTPTMEDAEAVLAKLDPPEAYAQGAEARAGAASPDAGAPRPAPVPPPSSATTAKPKFCWLALVGAFGYIPFMGSLLLSLAIGIPFAAYEGSRVEAHKAQWRQIEAMEAARRQAEEAARHKAQKAAPGRPAPDEAVNPPAQAAAEPAQPPAKPRPAERAKTTMFLCFGALPAISALWTVLFGIVSIVQIRRSHGQLYGMWLAVTDVVVCPAILVLYCVGLLLMVA
jgi:hypothetical protein